MDKIMEQMPIVINALNVGFIQTLKLFFVTLIGALPLGLIIAFGSMSRFRPLSWLTKIVVWIVRGTPLMIQLLIIYYFPGLVFGKTIWGSGEAGRFTAAAIAGGIAYSAAGIPANIVQGVTGIVIACVLLPILSQIPDVRAWIRDGVKASA